MFAIAESQEVEGLDWCKQALEVLNAHYPGHMWLARHDGGVLFIKNARLVGNKRNASMGFAMRADDLTDAKKRVQAVVRAGGELLERAGWPRGAWREGLTLGVMDGAK